MATRTSDTTRKWRIAAIVLVAAAAGYAAGGAPIAGQAFAQAQRMTDEVREFCANVIDAARDRRYAVQAQELEALRKEIDERVALLEAKRAEYEDWMKRREEVIDRAEDSVVGIYSRMRPDAAAERLAKLDGALAAAIIMKLNQRQAGIILNEMEARAAARLTSIIADVAKTEDPT
jgi:flagellar motility protein MotE (MotC chaperone)